MTTAFLVHGWRKTDPSAECYVVIEVTGDADVEVWESAAKLGPQQYWNHAHRLAEGVPDELKDRILTRAEVDQAAHTRLELFRALRQLSDNEAKCTRDETGYDHEDLIGWYKAVEKIFFTAAAHDELVGNAVSNQGIYGHVDSLLEVARLAIASAHKEEWSGEDLLDISDDPTGYLLLQDMPTGLRAAARAEYVRAKYAAAAAPEPPEPATSARPTTIDPKARIEALRRRFGSKKET